MVEFSRPWVLSIFTTEGEKKDGGWGWLWLVAHLRKWITFSQVPGTDLV